MAHRMLTTAPMSRTVLALVLVAASASVASAGPFVGLGIGTGAASSGELDTLDENGRSGRLMVGYRFPALGPGQISIEGLGTRYGMISPDGTERTGTTLGLAGKYSFPLQDNFEVFGRLGLQRTSISDVSGSGMLIGAGAAFKLPVAVANISVFVDYTIQHSSLSGPVSPTQYTDAGLTSRIWTLGALLSF
ncbi:MAG TPA: outer membrane beta-barrel protein [Kofleriaceae bacterium]